MSVHCSCGGDHEPRQHRDSNLWDQLKRYSEGFPPGYYAGEPGGIAEFIVFAVSYIRALLEAHDAD